MFEVDETREQKFKVKISIDFCEGQVVVKTAGGRVVVQLVDVEVLESFQLKVNKV